MRRISFETLITKSINRTKLILFKPFSLKKWFCLLLIGYLAGVIGGGGNLNFGGRESKDAEAVEQDYASENYAEQAQDSNQKEVVLDGWTGLPKGSIADKFCLLNSGLAWGIIVAIGLAVLVFVIFFTWLSARFKFIWFNAIVSNDASIKESFKRHEKEGNSLFNFFLIMLFVVLVFLGLMVLWVYINGTSLGVFKKGADIPIMQIIGAFALPAIVLIIGIILLAVLSVLIEHFVITIMAMEHCSFKIAWNKFMAIAGQNKKDMFLYLLVLMGLGIVSGILAMLVFLVCFIALLILAGLLIGLPYLLIVGLLKAKIVFLVFAVIVGVPLLILAILLFMSIGLPFAVFFRNFSLYFVSSLECGYLPIPLENAA